MSNCDCHVSCDDCGWRYLASLGGCARCGQETVVMVAAPSEEGVWPPREGLRGTFSLKASGTNGKRKAR